MMYSYDVSALHPGVTPQVYAATFTDQGTHTLLWAAMDQQLIVLDEKVKRGPDEYLLQNIPDQPNGIVQLFGTATYWEMVESMLLGYSEFSRNTPKVLTNEPEISDIAAPILLPSMLEKLATGKSARLLYKELQARRLQCESDLGLAACLRMLVDDTTPGEETVLRHL